MQYRREDVPAYHVQIIDVRDGLEVYDWFVPLEMVTPGQMLALNSVHGFNSQAFYTGEDGRNNSLEILCVLRAIGHKNYQHEPHQWIDMSSIPSPDKVDEYCTELAKKTAEIVPDAGLWCIYESPDGLMPDGYTVERRSVLKFTAQ